MTSQEKLAKIFRTNPEVIINMEEKMSALTGKQNIVDDLMKENDHRISRTLALINCRSYKSSDIRRALISKLQKDDKALWELFGKPDGTSSEGLQLLFKYALELANLDELFVLKKEKAEEFLRRNPPPNIIKALGYKGIDELLEKEDLIEIFSALRFIETNDWMHQAFDGTYPIFTPKDFEKRKVELRVLSGKWLDLAEKFVKKKYHNISHLKELGVAFVIPLKIDTPGELLRVFSLVLHYLHEMDFYSKLFEKAAQQNDFGVRLISLLKGDILESVESKENGINWLIVQRYLAKDNKEDPRLFIPHVNPEALHWKKTEQGISNLGKKFSNIDLEMWLDVDWVGGFFKKKLIGEDLVSFDLVDNVMALVQKEKRIKYLYHQQEALWNEIFSRYMGNDKLEQMMIDNFDKGVIEL